MCLHYWYKRAAENASSRVYLHYWYKSACITGTNVLAKTRLCEYEQEALLVYLHYWYKSICEIIHDTLLEENLTPVATAATELLYCFTAALAK
jgi:hypothetical protein